jgi:hypothetical protein
MEQVTTIGLIWPKQRFRCTGTGTTKGQGVEKGTRRFGVFDHLDDSGLPLTRHFEARSSVNRTPRHAEARVERAASLPHPGKKVAVMPEALAGSRAWRPFARRLAAGRRLTLFSPPRWQISEASF